MIRVLTCIVRDLGAIVLGLVMIGFMTLVLLMVLERQPEATPSTAAQPVAAVTDKDDLLHLDPGQFAAERNPKEGNDR